MGIIDTILVDASNVNKGSLRNYLRSREVITVEDKGAVPDGGTDSGAAFNLAGTEVFNAGGGIVAALGEAYLIETSFLQKSGVWLVLGPHTQLLAKTGLNAPVVKNATAVTSKTISGITNSGRTATATCTAHGYVAGDWVHISGASPDGYNGWHKVIAAPGVDTFTFYVDKNIAADSGTISVFKAVESNLKVIGGKILGNAANTTGDNYGLHYEGVVGFELDSLKVSGTYHNGVAITSAANGTLLRVNGDNVVHASHNGILLGQSSTVRYVENISLVRCEASGNGQDGIVYERGRGIRGFGNGGKYNGLCAIKIGKCDGVREIGSWGKYNVANGLQVQPSGTGSRNITVANGDYSENGESGIFVGNSDTSNPLVNLALLHNQCHRNGQIGSSTSYGIAFEVDASATVDRVTVEGNHCDEQLRGMSFSNTGTVSNLSVRGNRAKGNTVDANFGSSIQAATFEYGFNKFANTGGNGIILPAVYASSFPQILAKSGVSVSGAADTNLNTLATVTVPAGVLGANGELEIEAVFEVTNGADDKTTRVDFDGGAVSNSVVTTVGSVIHRIRITNKNAANSQDIATQRDEGSTRVVGIATGSVDTSAAKNITFKCQKETAGNTITLRSYRVLALVNS